MSRAVALSHAALATALAVGTAGCSVIAGEHEAETSFLVKPNTASAFSGWSEITVPEDPKSVSSAELMYIRLEAEDAGVSDLTFIQDITAQTALDGVTTKVAQKAPMPPGERIVPLDRVYHGDIRGFFYPETKKDGYTAHIDWHGSVNPAKAIPAEGIRMKVKVAVRIDD